MISLILPYWERQEAADKALRKLDELYGDTDLEVIVVDDGNRVPFRPPPGRLDIRVINLPLKDIAKCPATAWNAGAAAARGDIIVLSCVEILHNEPILEKMAAAVRNIGENGYVLASAWCPEDGSWHCHSTVKTPRNPWGTGIAFCAAMHRELFFKAGGFDEDYREGAGYEDNDWINRLLVAGARFVIRDDLVVTHPKTGASIAWGAERFARNEALYYSKWPQELRLNSVTFCCVNAGDYLGRGREYVEKLYGMLSNSLPEGLTFRFVCFTDQPFDGVECRPLPAANLIGWNQKIALFRPGLFPDGERVVFLDLDTLLLGRIDRLVDFQGEFAVLRDFWRPDGLGPAVMAWRAGFGHWIWDEYVKAGFPSLERGDQEWLEWIFARDAYQPAILQDLYPGLFCSYKADCNPHPPAGARVVCLHGLPRPHEVEGWVADVWNSRLAGSDVDLIANTALADVRANIHSASLRDIPWIEHAAAHGREILLVGGGPSLVGDIEDIRRRQAAGATVFTMNGTAALLRSHGITPDMHIIIDSRTHNLKFLDAAQTYLASQCAPAVFDGCANPLLFHIMLRDWDKYIPDELRDKPAIGVGGGHSVGLYAMSIAYIRGYRRMHLYGYDSSYRDSQHHAYEQPKNDADPVIDANVEGRVFKSTAWMVVQVNEYQSLSRQLADMGCTITTHGDGLLPYVAWLQMISMRAAA